MAQVLALDYSDGFNDPLVGSAAAAAFVIELWLFGVALRRITVSVAVGLFGLGTCAVAVVSIGWLGEPITTLNFIALLAVVIGAVMVRTDDHSTYVGSAG